jgi:hypothetical protein
LASGVKNIFVRTGPIWAVIPMGFPGRFGGVFCGKYFCAHRDICQKLLKNLSKSAFWHPRKHKNAV